MAKRVYANSVKKWLIGLGLGGTGTLVGGIFLYLMMVGAITITGHSGDTICAGTTEDPCYAYINFTANEDVFIYPTNYDPYGREVPMNFSPAVKSWKLQRSWGSGWREIPLTKTCTGTWCGLSNKDDERKFSWALREGRNYSVRIVAEKYDPEDTIKWGFFDLDPVWLPNSTIQIKDFPDDRDRLWDNYGSWNGARTEVVVRDLTGAIGKAKLLPCNEYSTVDLCKSIRSRNETDKKLVLRANITLFQHYPDVIQETKFRDEKNGSKEINKNFQWKLYNGTVDIIHDYIAEDCIYDYDTIVEINGIKQYKEISCTYTPGNYTEVVEDWVTLKRGDLQKDVPSTIGLFAIVNRGDTIDSLPTFMGVELTYWVVFTETLDNGLIMAYNFSETSGSSVFDMQENFTGTASNTYEMDVPGWDGEADGGMRFFATGATNNAAVNFDAMNLLSTHGTLGMWFNATEGQQSENQGVLLSTRGSYQYSCDYGKTNSEARCYGGSSGNLIIPNVNDEQWYLIIFTWDDTNGHKLFMNGTKIASSVWGGAASLTSGSNTLGVNPQNDDWNGYGGATDWFFAYDRELSEQEVQDFYDSFINGTIGPGVGSTITLTLDSPADEFVLVNQTLDAVCTAHDPEKIENVSLIVDGSYVTTNSSGINNSEYLFTDTLGAGIHTWNCQACNNQTSGFCINGTARNINVELNLSGTVKDTGDTAQPNSRVWVINESDNVTAGHTLANGTGHWTYGPLIAGSYAVCGYNPNNSTLRGDCAPFVVVP